MIIGLNIRATGLIGIAGGAQGGLVEKDDRVGRRAALRRLAQE